MASVTQNEAQSLVDNILKSQNTSSNDEDKKVQKPEKKTKSADKKTKNVIKGKPKSGRFWKSEKERFSSINKTKGIKPDFAKKTALRLELKRTKELSRQMLEELKQKQLEKKERRRENIKRTEENRKKSEVVQVITNTAKLKRMRKKQLRFIEKRDTNKQVEANK